LRLGWGPRYAAGKAQLALGLVWSFRGFFVANSAPGATKDTLYLLLEVSLPVRVEETEERLVLFIVDPNCETEVSHELTIPDQGLYAAQHEAVVFVLSELAVYDLQRSDRHSTQNALVGYLLLKRTSERYDYIGLAREGPNPFSIKVSHEIDLFLR